MITEIPTKEDFYEAGSEYCMMAYATIIDLFLVFEEHDLEEADGVEEYWKNARGKLKNAASSNQSSSEVYARLIAKMP